MEKNIHIRGARENNLKNIDLEIPRDKFTVLTGVSGSGKTSLAFDTIYAEGQRRYMESLSSYARQFLGQMEKPDVDSIEGLSPAIAIDQKTTNRNPRSTVGTVTEIYDYFRLLFARVGTPHCPQCGKEILRQTSDQIADRIAAMPPKTKVIILSPVVRGRKGEHTKVIDEARKSGYVRVRINGEIIELSEDIKLAKTKKHNIDIVVDRLVIKEGIQSRLAESIDAAAELSGGIIIANADDEEITFSQNFSCPDCGISLEEIEPRVFSFNNPAGACPECAGLGFKMTFDINLIIGHPELSIIDGAITAHGFSSSDKENSWIAGMFRAIADCYGFDINTPFEKLAPEYKDILLNGTNGKKMRVEFSRGKFYDAKFDGILKTMERRYKETSSEWSKQVYESLMTQFDCPVCAGKRLKPEILAVTVGEMNISDLTSMSVIKIKEFFNNLVLSEHKSAIAFQILREIKARTGFLVDVGLGYLTLARAAATLSGGEAQRIRLATQIGSGLVGVAYILDEPSIGLHQRDNDKLIATLKKLRDLGNTLIVVEHDSDTMLASDYIVDIGPAAGEYGGNVIFAGTPDEILKDENSITGNYLSGRLKIKVPEKRHSFEKFLTIKGAAENNLKNIDVDIPVGVLTCVTGVSGSGKSSLVNEILYKALAHSLNRAKAYAGKHAEIIGMDFFDKAIDIDQSPIGRTPRSNPATYTGLFDLIRDLFAQTTEAKIRGYQKGRFSFNVKGGRCEACGGDGIIKIEMHFLPDVYVPCEVCKGKRFNRETLEVKYKGKNISDVLDMTVDEAVVFFENLPRLLNKVEAMKAVGLGYIKLGQPSTTLSGGEAQRVKLATELSRRSTGKTFYILDEPTTGLHTADVHKLVKILAKLTDAGNTVVVIEHNLDVIKTADYVIDLGPEGGDAGGELVAVGTPEEIAECEKSYTGIYLKRLLGERV
ncbi:MAG: excinuclease ABC subunit UvrA [Clostridiales bacterium]|jgi:excinuclease ABC subunit A|nr:excinuclease ABC subunit UvrA [Clostridiales bacterium]